MPDWVLAAERAYVAAAIRGAPSPAGAPGATSPSTAASAPPPSTAASATPASTAASPSMPEHRAIAAAGAIASRYLAVGSPRSFSIILETAADLEAAALALVAHRTWFDPRDIRCAATTTGAAELAAVTGGRVVSLAEALACDIVNVHAAALHIVPAQLRRGTHVNLAAPATLDPELHQLAIIVHEADLPALAAGLVDGRQLDEITIFFADGAPIAALHAGPLS